MARIFISYAREDGDKVSALYAKLKEAGFTPWMDVEDIMPGEDWERAILTAISESHFIVACIYLSALRWQAQLHPARNQDQR